MHGIAIDYIATEYGIVREDTKSKERNHIKLWVLQLVKVSDKTDSLFPLSQFIIEVQVQGEKRKGTYQCIYRTPSHDVI